MSWLVVACGGAFFVFGLFLVFAALSYNRHWVQELGRRREAEARRTREAGYKLNMPAFMSWVWGTRFRLAAIGLIYTALGLWWVRAGIGS